MPPATLYLRTLRHYANPILFIIYLLFIFLPNYLSDVVTIVFLKWATIVALFSWFTCAGRGSCHFDCRQSWISGDCTCRQWDRDCKTWTPKSVFLSHRY